jgi:integrase
VQGWLADELARAPSPALHRLQFLLNFGYMTGMRLAELAAAKLGWLRHEQLDDGPDGHGWPGRSWCWASATSGARCRCRIRQSSALRASLVVRGLHPDPLHNDPEAPLVSKLDQEAPLSAARIYDILGGWLRAVRRPGLGAGQAGGRTHSGGVHALAAAHLRVTRCAGRAAGRLQANLGHESLATTSIYVRAEKARRHREMQRAFAPRGN